MTSILTNQPCIRSKGSQPQTFVSLGCLCPSISSGLTFSHKGELSFVRCYYGIRRQKFLCSSSVKDPDPQNPEDENSEDESSSSSETKGDGNESFRANLERIVGADDSAFNGIDLATLIRKKYGKSYDVQLIKKEFMGRNLLALNVMWKYREQKSFPLTEEEYILRLDDVANMLKCWGAVSHIRNSLANTKERPRIGKAVSIFIDMDGSGGRSNEWIYK